MYYDVRFMNFVYLFGWNASTWIKLIQVRISRRSPCFVHLHTPVFTHRCKSLTFCAGSYIYVPTDIHCRNWASRHLSLVTSPCFAQTYTSWGVHQDSQPWILLFHWLTSLIFSRPLIMRVVFTRNPPWAYSANSQLLLCKCYTQVFGNYVAFVASPHPTIDRSRNRRRNLGECVVSIRHRKKRLFHTLDICIV